MGKKHLVWLDVSYLNRTIFRIQNLFQHPKCFVLRRLGNSRGPAPAGLEALSLSWPGAHKASPGPFLFLAGLRGGNPAFEAAGPDCTPGKPVTLR